MNKCSYRASGVGATMKYFVEIESGDESALQAAVATQGPVATLVEASHNVFRVCVGCEQPLIIVIEYYSKPFSTPFNHYFILYYTE